MLSDIFNYKNYKDYLVAWAESQPRHGWGTRAQLAKIVGCQSAYVSQVLNGPLHFSSEQALSLSHSLGHAPEEAHYFLLLVQEARAGSTALQKYFREQREELQQRRFELKHRLGVAAHLEKEEQAIYYSSWVYAAVHVLTDVPNYQTKEAISKFFGFPLAKTATTLDFLVKTGLVNQSGDTFQMSRKSMHLGADSPHVGKHHCNWRLRAIESLEPMRDTDLHYSSVITLSRSDFDLVKTQLIEAIKVVKQKVRESKEEALFCFSLDLFDLERMN